MSFLFSNLSLHYMNHQNSNNKLGKIACFCTSPLTSKQLRNHLWRPAWGLYKELYLILYQSLYHYIFTTMNRKKQKYMDEYLYKFLFKNMECNFKKDRYISNISSIHNSFLHRIGWIIEKNIELKRLQNITVSGAIFCSLDQDADHYGKLVLTSLLD